MIEYKFRAKKGPQDIIEGRLEALSEQEAVEKIGQMGYLALRVEKVDRPNESKIYSVSKFLGKVKYRQVTIFSRELASLLKSGVPILDALNIISEQSDNPKLRDILRSIHNAVKEGVSFSSALANFPKVFPSLYIALIRSGEDSGTLPEALFRIADYRIKREDTLSRLRMALAYPILMAVVGTSTIIFMLTFVMPRLMRIFTNIKQELPLPTKILITISTWLRQWWFWIVLILVAIILVIRRQAKTKSGRLFLSSFQLRLPVAGRLILKAELSRFSRTLELLIKNGIPILKAIDIAIPVLENELIKDQLKLSYKELEQGGSFGSSLKKSKLFPLFMSNLVIVGEKSGGLEESLSEVANSFERDTDEALKIMNSLLEPLMMLVMGLIVGFIVIAMLLPIFEINVMAR